MKIHKIENGISIITEFIKIKEYERFSLYQVYLIQGNKKIPIYKECYTDMQLKEKEALRRVKEVDYGTVS